MKREWVGSMLWIGNPGEGHRTNLPLDALSSALCSARRSEPHPSIPGGGKGDLSWCGRKRASFVSKASRFSAGEGIASEEDPRPLCPSARVDRCCTLGTFSPPRIGEKFFDRYRTSLPSPQNAFPAFLFPWPTSF